jgi:hypothetical protein
VRLAVTDNRDVAVVELYRRRPFSDAQHGLALVMAML